MLRIGLVAPAVLLDLDQALPRQHVGIRPAQARRLVGAVEVDHHVPLGGLPRDPIAKIDHLLIVAVHEVDLDAPDAPLGKAIERRFALAVQRRPDHPQHHAHVLLLRIGADRLHIQVGVDLEQVGPIGPAVVEEEILEAEFRREVDEILRRSRIDAGFEIHAVDVPPAPPVERHHPRLDPRDVVEGQRRREQIDQLIGNQVTVAASDRNDAPRIGSRATGPGDVVGVPGDAAVHVGAAFIRFLKRIAGKGRLQRGPARAAQPHARIVPQVRLGDENPGPARWRYEQRQTAQILGLQLTDRLLAVGLLVGGAEALFLLADHRRRIGKLPTRPLGGNDQITRQRRREPVCHAVVVCAKRQSEIRLERQHQLVVPFRDHGVLLANLRTHFARNRIARLPRDAGVGSHDVPVGNHQRQSRHLNHRPAVDAHREIDPLAHLHSETHRPIRTAQLVAFGKPHTCTDKHDHSNKHGCSGHPSIDHGSLLPMHFDDAIGWPRFGRGGSWFAGTGRGRRRRARPCSRRRAYWSQRPRSGGRP